MEAAGLGSTDWTAGDSVKTQSPPSFQGPRVSISSWSLAPVESLKNWSTRPGGRDPPDAERWLAHAFEGEREGLHMRDFAGHKELQCVLRAGIVGEIDDPLVDDLCAGFCGDVAPQIDVEFARDLEVVVGGPGVALRVEEVHAGRRRRSRSEDRPRRPGGRTSRA
jgi:hypothetical protein